MKTGLSAKVMLYSRQSHPSVFPYRITRTFPGAGDRFYMLFYLLLRSILCPQFYTGALP